MLGTAVFLVGVAVALFLDDVLPADSSLLPWVEPIGAIILLIGLTISRIWKSEKNNPDNSV
jgi:energy-converting hydrogenase Eha subunit C